MSDVGTTLDELSAKFRLDFAAFEVYQFPGTSSEFSSLLLSWSRPAGVELRHLNITGLTSACANFESAKALVDAELKKLSEISERLLITVQGLHLLAVLYPGGILQPLHRWLRRGNRVVVLIVPDQQPIKLPASVRAVDWRASISSELDQDHTLILGDASHAVSK